LSFDGRSTVPLVLCHDSDEDPHILFRLLLFGFVQLKNVAGAFKGTSDPYAVVTLLANSPNEKPRVLGKTEVYVPFLTQLLTLVEGWCSVGI